MESKELIKQGRLIEARRQLTEEVRNAPSDDAKRTLLFHVLLFSGEWDKAQHHLDVIALQDAAHEPGFRAYADLIAGERERKTVREGKSVPGFLSQAPSYTDGFFHAMEELKNGRVEHAESLIEDIAENRPTIRGTVNGRRFNGIINMDGEFSFFVETIVHNRYVWFPFESLRELSIAPPVAFLDLLWVPANITTWEGLSVNCHMPVLYPDSSTHEDDRVKMGRMTDWVPMGGSFYKGMGQQVFLIGEEEVPILEIRDMLFDFPERGEVHEGKD